MKDLIIGVVGGLGHIGLIQAACLAKLGYKIIAYDVDIVKIENIFEGKMPFLEAGLSELISETVDNKMLSFTSDISELKNADIVFICVGTPSLPSGEADLSQIYSAIDKLALNISNKCLIVIKSTVPVGTSRRLTEYLAEKMLSEKLTMISNPEFLKEGCGVQDFWNPSRIVVGSESKAIGEIIASLYSPQVVPVMLTTWENAELIKLVSNAFLSTKISFINEIANLCENVGADIRIVSRGIGMDPRINPFFLEAGVGFSGPCLEKDLKSLIKHFNKVNTKAAILESVLQVNEAQRQNIVSKLVKCLGTLFGKKIAVLGMAFKQETDDVRQSHSVPIVKELLSLGAIVTVNDPWVTEPHIGGLSEADLPGVNWVSSPYEAAEGKDALLILTAWNDYKTLDLHKIRQSMANPLIVDGRNMYQKEDMYAQQINYVGVGI